MPDRGGPSPDPEALRELAELEPDGRVLSVHCRTDPRDPANRSASPAWAVELRNGLRGLAARLEEDGSREERLALRELAERVESELRNLSAEDRGRSLSWFVTADGSLDRRFASQLPLRADAVVWDARPYVSPLVDVVERGRSTGLVLVGGERVRLLHWRAGAVEEPQPSTYELELGDWRRYESPAGANPARAQQTATNVAAYEQRVEEWRRRFLEQSAEATAKRMGELGWERVLVAAEGQVAPSFSAALPGSVRERVIAELDLNVVDEPPAEVAGRIEPRLEELWLEEARALASTIRERGVAGGHAALGADETLAGLAESRVEHLLIDPLGEFDSALGDEAREVLRGAGPEMLAERAVEAAILSAARVTSLPASESEPLAEAGGIAALLRF